jgi:hypothetical protein
MMQLEMSDESITSALGAIRAGEFATVRLKVTQTLLTNPSVLILAKVPAVDQIAHHRDTSLISTGHAAGQFTVGNTVAIEQHFEFLNGPGRCLCVGHDNWLFECIGVWWHGRTDSSGLFSPDAATERACSSIDWLPVTDFVVTPTHRL